jgi:hypothetical protein
MGPVVYKEHTIIASGDLDEVSGTYIPMASINWIRSDGKRAVHVLTESLKRFVTFEEASNFAVDSAKMWLDHRRSARD